MWCTRPMSVDVRVGSGSRSSFVNTVISRPSPGSKYRWLSDALSRFGCSKTNGMPSTPSQKSIDVCRFAPTSVMWWTPWVWSLRIARDPSPLRTLDDPPPVREAGLLQLAPAEHLEGDRILVLADLHQVRLRMLPADEYATHVEVARRAVERRPTRLAAVLVADLVGAHVHLPGMAA